MFYKATWSCIFMTSPRGRVGFPLFGVFRIWSPFHWHTRTCQTLVRRTQVLTHRSTPAPNHSLRWAVQEERRWSRGPDHAAARLSCQREHIADERVQFPSQRRPTLRPLFPKREANFRSTVRSRTYRGDSPPPPTASTPPQTLVILQSLTNAGRKSLSVLPRPPPHRPSGLPTVSGSGDPQQAVSARTVGSLPRSVSSCNSGLPRCRHPPASGMADTLAFVIYRRK